MPAPRQNPTGRDISLTAPIRDGAFVLGEIDFVLKADDSLTIDAGRLITLLTPVIGEARTAALRARIPAPGQVAASDFAAAGYVIRYDPETIALAIAIPPDARAARALRLSQLNDTLIGTVDAPASFSGYINFRSSADYTWQGSDQGFRTPFTLIDSAIRYRGFVLENEGTLQFDDTLKGYRREGTRVVYDDRDRLARWTAGDLEPVTRGFAGAPQMAGVSIARSYSLLEPQRNVQPRGERTFTITRPSTVEAFINGQSIRRTQLQPGIYNVSDFPFVQGANDVELVIDDGAGGRETISFSLFFDRTLLAKGLTEFGLYGGMLSRSTLRGRRYFPESPAVAGFFRRGFTDSFTGGASFQAQRRGAVLSGEAAFATTIGTVGGDVAASYVRGLGAGYAVNVGFQRNFGGTASSGRSVSLTAEHRSKNFATPNDIIADNRFSLEVAATYSQSIGPLQFISATAQYSKARAGFTDSTLARLTYGYRLTSRINLTAEALYEDRLFQRRSYGARVNLIMRFGARSSAVAEYDTRRSRARIGVATSSGDGVGAWSASGDADYGDGTVGVNGSVTYTANRADLGVSHTTVFNTAGTRITDQRTSLRMGTAITFADGSFALSRPIFDSFVMVKPHRSLKGADVLIDPREGHYTSKSGIFGPAVDPNLSAYTERAITYDVPDAPPGYDLGAGAVRVLPPYRSGYLVTAGSDYSIVAVGTLKDVNGDPVSLLAGKATELAHPDRAPITLFTNRAGRFGLQGLRPGKWRIEMPTEPAGAVIITVPEGETSLFNAGEITLEPVR